MTMPKDQNRDTMSTIKSKTKFGAGYKKGSGQPRAISAQGKKWNERVGGDWRKLMKTCDFTHVRSKNSESPASSLDAELQTWSQSPPAALFISLRPGACFWVQSGRGPNAGILRKFNIFHHLWNSSCQVLGLLVSIKTNSICLTARRFQVTVHHLLCNHTIHITSASHDRRWWTSFLTPQAHFMDEHHWGGLRVICKN